MKQDILLVQPKQWWIQEWGLVPVPLEFRDGYSYFLLCNTKLSKKHLKLKVRTEVRRSFRAFGRLQPRYKNSYSSLQTPKHLNNEIFAFVFSKATLIFAWRGVGPLVGG